MTKDSDLDKSRKQVVQGHRQLISKTCNNEGQNSDAVDKVLGNLIDMEFRQAFNNAGPSALRDAPPLRMVSPTQAMEHAMVSASPTRNQNDLSLMFVGFHALASCFRHEVE